MRAAYALTLFGWCILCSGCALLEDGTRNLCVAISTPIETHRENARNRQWADTAWQNICLAPGPWARTEDYARGFKEGYAEYLFRGGDGEPPLVAPLRYRHVRYQTPDGYRAIEDWFSGYRHGSSVARDTGARNWITGPSGLHGESMGMAEPPRVSTPVEQFPVLPPPRLAPVQSIEENPPEPPKFDLHPPRIESIPQPALIPKIVNISELPKPVSEPKVEAPEPAKIKILKVREAPSAVLELTKPRITGISVAGPAPDAQVSPEAQVAPVPVRARITTITVAPQKD